MKVEKIYFDMDDTIADFDRGLIDICHIDPVSQNNASRDQDDNMWAAIKEADHFYYRLKECRPGIDLLHKLRAVYGNKVEILSSVPKAERGIKYAEDDKRLWVIEHIGADITVNITYTAGDKAKYIRGEGYFLVDDSVTNIDSCIEAGGTGILFNKDNPDATAKQVAASNLM